MQARDWFGERVNDYVCREADAMKRTPRRADTSYPTEISDLIKSASKAQIDTVGKAWDSFQELSDISWTLRHKIIHKEWRNSIIQTPEEKSLWIEMKRDDDGRLVVWYQGKTYHEFDRSWNVYSHSTLLAQDIQKYGKISIDQWLMNAQELQYDIWRALTHDALSETEISDMESVRKTPAWRAYEDQTEKRMIAKHFPQDQEFVQWLLWYDKKSPFKTADRIQATLDVFHMMCHPENQKRNYANRMGTSYEVTLAGLARLTDPRQIIHFAQESRHPLQVQALLQQIKDQWVAYFSQFLKVLKEGKREIWQQIRYPDKHEMWDVWQWLDSIEKNMNTINDAVAKI